MRSELISFGVDLNSNKPMQTTVQKIIDNRVLLEGDSGSGKSHAKITFVEQTDDMCQRILIDLEGEDFTLKKNFSFLLVGRSNNIVKADIELNTNDVYIEQLAKRLLEKSVDAIIDLSEVSESATHFVQVFFDALLRYSKLMKRPLLLFLDEAQEFASEKGMGKEESLKAVMRMAKRGRKHGIGLICMTQAIADFNKNVVRQLRIRFIGNCTYDRDVKQACEYLGFDRSREHELRDLGDDHQFFVGSQGILIDGKKPSMVTKMRFIKNKTELYDFKFNKNIKIQDKNPHAIKEIVATFNDIPAMVDSELSELESLRKEVIDLRGKIRNQSTQFSSNQPKVLQENYESGYKKGYSEGVVVTSKTYEDKLNKIRVHFTKFRDNLKNISDLSEKIKTSCVIIDGLEMMEKIAIESPLKPNVIMEKTETSKSVIESLSVESNSVTKLRSGAMKMLSVCATYHPKPVSKTRMKTLSGVTPKSFDTYLSELKKLEWVIVNGDLVNITPLGLTNVGDIEKFPTNPTEIISMWKTKFRAGVGKILDVLRENYVNGATKEYLTEKTGFSGKTLDTYLSELKSNGLIETIGKDIVLSKDIFQ